MPAICGITGARTREKSRSAAASRSALDARPKSRKVVCRAVAFDSMVDVAPAGTS